MFPSNTGLSFDEFQRLYNSKDLRNGNFLWTPKRYSVTWKLGQGGQGQVWSANDTKKNGEKVAIKVLSLKLDDVSKMKHSYREFMLLSTNNHPNLMNLLNAYSPQVARSDLELFKELYLVTSQAHSTLQKLINNDEQISHDQKCSIIYQILCGLDHLHKSNIYHRDLKPENIAVYETKDNSAVDYKIKLFDFGLSAWCTGVTQTHSSTPPYKSPELLVKKKPYEFRIDIWALGCVFVELITGNMLFATNENDSDDKLWRRIVKVVGLRPDDSFFGCIPEERRSLFKLEKEYKAMPWDQILPIYCFKEEGLEYDAFAKTAKLAQNLLSQMLQIHPERRCTAENALKHEYFRKWYNPSDFKCASTTVYDASFDQTKDAGKVKEMLYNEIKSYMEKTDVLGTGNVRPTAVISPTIVNPGVSRVQRLPGQLPEFNARSASQLQPRNNLVLSAEETLSQRLTAENASKVSSIVNPSAPPRTFTSDQKPPEQSNQVAIPRNVREQMKKKLEPLRKVAAVCDIADKCIASKDILGAFAALDAAIHHNVCRAPELQQILLQKTLHCCLSADDKKKYANKLVKTATKLFVYEPQSKQAYYCRALGHKYLKNAKDSIANCETLLKIDPSHDLAKKILFDVHLEIGPHSKQLKIADRSFTSKNFEISRDIYKEVIQREANDYGNHFFRARLWYNVAICIREAGRKKGVINWIEVRKSLDKAIRYDDKEIDFFCHRACANYCLRDYPEFYSDMNIANRMDPNNKMVKDLMEKAENLAQNTGDLSKLKDIVESAQKNGDLESARLLIQQTKYNAMNRAQNSKAPNSLFQLEQLFYINNEDYEALLQSAQTAIKQHPGNSVFYLNSATANFRLYNIKNAILDAKMAVKLDPKNQAADGILTHLEVLSAKSVGLCEQANLARRDGEYENALNHLSQAIKLEEENGANLKAVRFLLSMKCAWANTFKRYDVMEETATKLIEFDPDYPYSWLCCSIAKSELNKHDEAFSMAEQACKMDPENTDHKIYLGITQMRASPAYSKFKEAEVCYSKKDYEKTIKLADEGIEMEQKMTRISKLLLAEFWYYKAVSHFATRKFAEAIECARKTIEFHPDKIHPHILYADATIQLNESENLDEVLSNVKRIAATHPNKEMVQNDLKDLEIKKLLAQTKKAEERGQTELIIRLVLETINFAKTANSEKYSDVFVADKCFKLGKIYAKQERYQEAVDQFTSAIHFDSSEAEYFGCRALANCHLKKFEIAFDDFKAAQKMKPEFRILKQEFIQTMQNCAELIKSHAVPGFQHTPVARRERVFTYRILAFIWTLFSNYENAQGYLNTAVETARSAKLDKKLLFEVYRDQQKCCQIMGDFSGTIELATKIIKLEPTYQHYYNRAELYFDQNKLDEAYSDVQAALKLNSFHEFSIQLKIKIEIKQAQARFRVKQEKESNDQKKEEEFVERL